MTFSPPLPPPNTLVEYWLAIAGRTVTTHRPGRSCNPAMLRRPAKPVGFATSTHMAGPHHPQLSKYSVGIAPMVI